MTTTFAGGDGADVEWFLREMRSTWALTRCDRPLAALFLALVCLFDQLHISDLTRGESGECGECGEPLSAA